MESADALFEGFRPGVMERLGLGPDVALARNPKLVYGRMTGWGQVGPYANAAGHDMNYIAITGALHAIGTRRQAAPAAQPGRRLRRRRAAIWRSGLLAGVLERARRPARARSSTAAMVDGAGLADGDVLRLQGQRHVEGRARAPTCSTAARTSTTPTDAPTASWISVGSIEPQFYALLLEKLGVTKDPALRRAEGPQR